jgi:CheY-like chemotaxis protein
MPKSVLVADDSLTIRKVIGMLLATEDITLTVVDNGLDAVSRARELRPDLVLADCMMPGKSGYEVCEAIKRDPALSQTPVLLLAGTFEPFDPQRAQQAGANGHIVKPFDSTSFLEKVKGLVGIVSATVAPYTVGTVQTQMPTSTAAHAPAPAMQPPRPMPGMAGVPPQGQPRPPAGIPMGTQSRAAMPPGAQPPPPQQRPPGPMPMGQPGMPRPPGQGIPQGTQPGMLRPPGQGIPQGTQPGMLRPPGQGIPQGTQPGMLRPPGPGMPPGNQPGMRPPGAPGQMPQRPMGVPGVPGSMGPNQQLQRPGPPPPGMPPTGFPRPPGAAPLPGSGQPPRRDPYGLGAPGQPPMQARPMQAPPGRQAPEHETLSLDEPKDGIVIPPPNVTGSLHMGHALTTRTIEDILIRYKRMTATTRCGCPAPTTPASRRSGGRAQLEAEGLDRHDLGREEFSSGCGQWKEQSGDRITSSCALGRVAATGPRALHHGRGPVARRARGLRRSSTRGPDLPRHQAPGELGPAGCTPC